MSRTTRLPSSAARVVGDQRGATAVIFALVLPVVGMLVAAGIELAFLVTDKARMQAVADDAALMGARAMAVTTHDGVVERAKAYAKAELSEMATRSKLTVTGEVDAKTKAVTVNIHTHRMSFFGSLLPPGGFHLETNATAVGMGAPLCVLALKTKDTKIINAKDSAKLQSAGCSVQSDSDIVVEKGASISAASVRSVGASSGAITPQAQVGAQIIPDPFAAVNIGAPAKCAKDDDDKIVATGTTSLGPGIHCGKVEVKSGASLNLLPGDHYFMKELQVKEDATLQGADVVVVLGKDGKLSVQDKAKLMLDGRKSGALAGFVLVAARGHKNDMDLMSENARKLHGTVYVPDGRLRIDGKSKVAEQSPWTVIVAERIELKGSATLVVNADYSSSSVPVPSGVGSTGLKTRLVE